MKKVSGKHLSRPVILLACAALLAACGGAFSTFTLPSDFSYEDGQQLTSRMQQLGYSLQQLDQALASANDDRPDLQQQVLGILRDIERVGGTLESGEIAADHPFFEDDITTFMTNVRAAREGVAMNPPRYYLAGRIAGGCVNCHRTVR